MWLCLSVFFLLIESRWQAVGHLHACMQGWKGEVVTIKIDSRVDQCLKSRKLFVLPLTCSSITTNMGHSGTVYKKKEKHEGHNTRKPFNLKAVLPLSERVTFYSLKTKEKNVLYDRAVWQSLRQALVIRHMALNLTLEFLYIDGQLGNFKLPWSCGWKISQNYRPFTTVLEKYSMSCLC